MKLTSINEVTGKDLASVLYGFVDIDTEYPKAMQKLKDAGMEEYVAEVQRQVDELLAAKPLNN